jgi:hypothetical protein
MNFLVHLRQEWDAIKQSPIACILSVVIGFAVGGWYYSGRLATLETQVSYWKDRAPSGTSGSAVAAGLPVATQAEAPPAARFLLDTRGISLYPSPEDNSSTGIILDVQMRNPGDPSIATDWRLAVTPRGSSPVMAQLNPIPAKMLAPTNPPMTLHGKDDLSEKVRSSPVPSGKLVDGKLLFYVRLPLSDVEDSATELKLSVQDIAGAASSTTIRVGDRVR